MLEFLTKRFNEILIFVSIFLLILVCSTAISTYVHFIKFKYSSPENVTLEINSQNFRVIARDLISRDIYKVSLPPPPATSDLPTFHISINPKTLSTLNSKLPDSGSNFKSAYLRLGENGSDQKVQLKYRGQNYYHWFNPKKSLRIKTDSHHPIFNHTVFNLINPPHSFMINEVINYEISREIGILSPECFPVRVFLNGDYSGVYLFVSQINEGLLRTNNRMPGSIYSGDNLITGENASLISWFDKLENNESILTYPEWWEKISYRNSEQKYYDADIRLLTNGFKLNGFEFRDFFDSYLDKDKILNFLAYDTYTGTIHHDLSHNHKVYFDPYKGKYEWIQWDLRYWRNDKYIKDIVLHPLLKKLKLDPVLEYEKDKYTFNLIKKYPVENIKIRIQNVVNLIHYDLKADYNRDSVSYDLPFPKGYSQIYSLDDFKVDLDFTLSTLKERHVTLMNYFNDCNSVYHVQKFTDESFVLLTFALGGNSPIDIKFSKVLSDLGLPLDTEIYKASINGQQVTKTKKIISNNSIERLYPGRKLASKNLLDENNTLLYGDSHITNYPLYYSFILPNIVDIGQQHTISAQNSVTGAVLNINSTKFINSTVFDFTKFREPDSIHPWQLEKDETIKTLTLKGDISFLENVIFDKYTNVTIEPGTRIKLAPKVSLIFYGVVNFSGTQQEPISISRISDKSEPWGSIVLQGQKTSGSRLQNVIISGGSTTSYNLINYPGQVNIHDTKDITVDSCSFSFNSIGDDNLHLAYNSNVVISNSIFLNSNSDALDIDISDVTITGNAFIESGNDSLDFMTSKADIFNNVFINANDKCFSIGENSDVIIHGNYLNKCNIGLEVKDNSLATIKNIFISNSKSLSINLYNKNPHYSLGGNADISDIYIHGNNKITKDEFSSITKGNIFNHPPPEAFFQLFDNMRFKFRIDQNYDLDINYEF